MFLSIIIPVYNVKDYLHRCVDSVLTECANLDYEAILVDDGSTDGSGELCEAIAQKHTHFHVCHKSNGGLSDARNFGLAKAKGIYVFYLDSDDYLAKGGLRKMVQTAKEDNSDVICGNFYYQYVDHQVLFDAKIHGKLTYQGGEEALSVLVEGNRYQNFAWGKLIRTELAQKHIFPKGKLFEDVYWFHWILHEANQITVIETPVVHYFQREGSISFNYNPKSLDILDGYVERLLFFKENYPSLINKQKWLMAQNCISQGWMICRYLKKPEKIGAIKKLKSIINHFTLKDNYLLNKQDQITLKLLTLNVSLYFIFTLFIKVRNKLKSTLSNL